MAPAEAPPPFPVVKESRDPKPLPPPVPHLRAPEGLKEEDLLSTPSPARRSLLKPLLLTVLLGLAGAAAFVYRPWERWAGPPPPASVPSAPVARSGPTPSATLNAIASAPGAAVGKARDVVNARRELEQDRVNDLANGQEPTGPRALNPPPPASLGGDRTAGPNVAFSTTSELAPGVSASTQGSEVSGPASPAFQAWVTNARINGVFQGVPPRALINGRTVRAGQIIDDALGITFDSFDPETKTLTFRDPTGATVSRRY